MKINIILTLILICLSASFINAVKIGEDVILYPSNNNVYYNLTQEINTTNLTVTDSCIIIDDPRLNDSYCISSGILREVKLPNTNTTGIIQNISISEVNLTEGDTVNFELELEDDVDDSWVNWILNGIKQATGRVWNWIIGYDSYENNPNNVSVYVREEDGEAYRYDLFFTVEDENLPPVIEDFYQSPSEVTFNNETISMFCNVSDEELSQSELNVDMAYRLSPNNQWVELSPVYNPGLDIWVSSVNSLPQYSWITTLDFRCSVTDNKSAYSGYQYDYDSVLVTGEQVAPTTPGYITPQTGEFDVVIPIKCQGSTDGNLDQITYVIEARFNETYKEIGRHYPRLNYEWDISQFRFNETTLRCYATDYKNSSEYIYSENLTIEHDVNHYLYYNGLKLLPKVNERVVFKNYCNTIYSDNLKIYGVYLDCNRDNLYDYYYGFENETNKYFNKKMSCLYPKEGNYNLESGCIIQRINESISWKNETVCNDLDLDDEYCNLIRSRSIEVLEND